jgi:hypothetical protein
LKTSGKSFTTNVGKNNTCPKCNLVIFKAEELIAAGERVWIWVEWSGVKYEE